MLEVTFRSTAQGEVHAIGFDTDDALSAGWAFAFWGTQSWGIRDFHTYDPASGAVTYTIPVGQYFTGSFDRLIFAMDHDVASPTGESVFSDIRLYEESGSPPHAAFQASCAELGCSFTDQSTDSDGTIVAWSWEFGDGASASTQNPAHTYAGAGSYTVRLTATDDSGATASTSQTVSVTVPNSPPIAYFTEACTDLSCSFTDGSTDGDGTIVSRSWDFGDGQGSTIDGAAGAEALSHSYQMSGTYTVQLTVIDNQGAAASTDRSVTVSAPNAPPVATFSYSCTGLSCNFADTSTDDGTVTSWTWDFGDGRGSTTYGAAFTGSLSHTYAAGGTYRVSLAVTDDGGLSTSVSQQVTVSGPVTFHVADIDGSVKTAGSKFYWGQATVLIQDATVGQPIAGATVHASWSGDYDAAEVTGVTDASGQVLFETGKLNVQKGASVTLTVTNVSQPEGVYAPDGNHDPDGDSDGTTIIITP